MQPSLLPESRRRLAAITAVTEESAAFDHVESPGPRTNPRGDARADPLWLGLIGVSDPARRAAWCRAILDTALYAGVPRLLSDLTPPTGVGLIILAASREALPCPILEQIATLEAQWRTHADPAADLVFVARALGSEHLRELTRADALTDCEILQSWCLAAAAVAVILEAGEGARANVSILEAAFSRPADCLIRFFDSRAFRGPRRSAARRAGPQFIPPPESGWIATPVFLRRATTDLLRSPGFRSFAAETLHAMARAAVRRSGLEEIRMDDLIDTAKTLVVIGNTDGPNEVDWIVPTLERLQDDAKESGVMPTEKFDD